MKVLRARRQGTDLAVILSTRLGVSEAEAHRRIAEATELGYG